MDYDQFRERVLHRGAERERQAKRTQFRFTLLFVVAGILLVVSAILGYLSFRT